VSDGAITGVVFDPGGVLVSYDRAGAARARLPLS